MRDDERCAALAGVFESRLDARLGAVAGGAALGIMAMLGRKAAVQAPTLMAGDWDEALAADPLLVKRLRRMRSSRQKARAARNLGMRLD